MRTGDRGATDELLEGVCDRLEKLTRKMLKRFPTVRRWADTCDVLQNSLLRLLRALKDVRPNSTRDFFGLAAEQMRRELLDLVRHFRGPMAIDQYESGILDGSKSAPGLEPVDLSDDLDDLERWAAFHEGVERLPDEEREVVALIFYHGWSQRQVAEMLQMSTRTIKRRWESALLKLREGVED
ncbi:MAG TPA: sigma-70 family RNA polymerase sigma factor [Chloroflexota bacterium]|nr:sigma-70 family RNA polymerase sigma factor [Chloroflexota bacterium]